MHLVAVKMDQSHSQGYHKQSLLTRPYSLCSIFRKLRQNRGLTKRRIAIKFGTSEDYISAIENGSKLPSLRYCLFCANLFDANPSWVKEKFANECIERFSSRLKERLGLDL